MIKHIVLWRLKDEALGRTKAENAELMRGELEGLAGLVPGLLGIEVGVAERAIAGWDAALYSEFESQAALDAYQVHPEHQAVAEFIGEVTLDRAAVDYEV